MFSHRQAQTLLLFTVVLFLFSRTATSAQNLPFGNLAKKRLPATILGRRTLIVPDPFNASRTLHRLFPGTWYDLSSRYGYTDRLISWVCPACKPAVFADAKMEEDTARFPDPGGVHTR